MLSLAWAWCLIQQISTQLTDILKQRATIVDDIVPKAASREMLAQQHRAAADQCRSAGHDTTYAVVHRQAIVHSVVNADVHHAGKPVAPSHDPMVTHYCRLGQAGRSRRVDIKSRVSSYDNAPL